MDELIKEFHCRLFNSFCYPPNVGLLDNHLLVKPLRSVIIANIGIACRLVNARRWESHRRP